MSSESALYSIYIAYMASESALYNIYIAYMASESAIYSKRLQNARKMKEFRSEKEFGEGWPGSVLGQFWVISGLGPAECAVVAYLLSKQNL